MSKNAGLAGESRSSMPDFNDPRWWIKEIRRSTDKRDALSKTYEWDKMKELFNSAARNVTLFKESDKAQGAVPFRNTAFVNWPWAFAQTFIPAVYWRHPHVNVRPLLPKHMAGVKFVEPQINATMKYTKFRLACRKALNDVCTFGHGWVKLGWYTKFGEVPPTSPAVTGEGKGMSTLSQETYLQMDAAYAYRVPPHMLFVDPEADCIEEARWIVQESVVAYEDVQKDPYLTNKKNIAPLIYKEEREDAILPVKTSNDYNERENRWVKVYEIWDRERKRVLILCSGSEKWNRVIDPWPYKSLTGFPFKLLTVTDAVDSMFPPSPILPWLSLVEELSFLRSIRMEHISKMVRKILAPTGTFDEDQLKQLLDPAQDFVECNSTDQVKDFDGLKPDPNLYASEEQVKQDIREISGFSEILSGSVPFSRIAATTSAIMERNATIRFDHYSERLGDFIIECAEDLFKITRDLQEYPAITQAQGGDGPQFIEFNKADIDGSYQFSLDLDEMSVASKQQRIKEAFDIFSVAAQAPQIFRLRSMARDLLLAFGKNDLDDYLEPPAGSPVDPGWENQMMLSGLPVEPNPNEDFELHLTVHSQFLQDPQVQAQLRSQPPILNLFSEHIQKTNNLAQMSQMMGSGTGASPGGGGGVSPTQSMQQGQQMAGSSAPVGPTNQGRGGGQQNFMRSAALARGGGV